MTQPEISPQIPQKKSGRNTCKRQRRRERRLSLQTKRAALQKALLEYAEALKEHRPGQESEVHAHILQMSKALLLRPHTSPKEPQRSLATKPSSASHATQDSNSPKRTPQTIIEENSCGQSSPEHPLIVLYQPEIPPNTGTIARLCAAFRMKLVLIGPLGFSVTEKAFRRAGLDYWPWVDLVYCANWEEFLLRKLHKRLIAIETTGETSVSSLAFAPGDALVFGSETRGLPDFILLECGNAPHRVIKIPMFQNSVRSLNLANCVAIAASHAIHRQGERTDP